MRQMQFRDLAILAVLNLVTIASAQAQVKQKEVVKVERTIAATLVEFNKEMRGYERELKYFRKTPEFTTLFELRTQLVDQSAEMGKLDTAGRGSGPAMLKIAREMDRAARKLNTGTKELDKRAATIGNRDGQVVAERMRVHADAMVKTTDGLISIFR